MENRIIRGMKRKEIETELELDLLREEKEQRQTKHNFGELEGWEI